VFEVIVVPIYEYQCQSCQHELEALQRLADAALVECPACAQATLKKKISAAGFRLKGGGWYETDFKSGSKKNLASDGGSTTAKTESSASKPAASESKTSA
jgi:putative FmdB family regulatory protein